MTATAYVALGSNLDDPPSQLAEACRALQRLQDCRLDAASSVYRSSPVGPQDQPDYLNAVLRLRTSLQPSELLHAMQRIERQQGRSRKERWGPRPLDLDLLLYDDIQMVTDSLTLPHPRMHERDFVLRPLREVCSTNLVLPNGGDLDTLLRACPDNNLVTTQHVLPVDHAAAG